MPPLSCTSEAYRPENAGCLDRLNRFASDYRLREMKFSGRNINRVLRAAAGPERAAAFFDGFRRQYRYEAEWRVASSLRSGPFDHAECWGRDRMPLVLIGHPYHFGPDRTELLRSLESLGLVVTVSRSAGWYGFGTYHVRASVPGVLPEPTAGERFETEMILDA